MINSSYVAPPEVASKNPHGFNLKENLKDWNKVLSVLDNEVGIYWPKVLDSLDSFYRVHSQKFNAHAYQCVIVPLKKMGYVRTTGVGQKIDIFKNRDEIREADRDTLERFRDEYLAKLEN